MDNAFEELREEAGGRFDPRAVEGLENLYRQGALDATLASAAQDAQRVEETR